jgi:hypothetical protein
MVVESTTIHTKRKEKRKHATDKRLAWQNSHMKQKHCLKKDGNKRDMQCERGKEKTTLHTNQQRYIPFQQSTTLQDNNFWRERNKKLMSVR